MLLRKLVHTVFYKILNSKDLVFLKTEKEYIWYALEMTLHQKSFIFQKVQKRNVCIRDILDEAPIPSKYYLSDVYVNTLRSIGQDMKRQEMDSDML